MFKNILSFTIKCRRSLNTKVIKKFNTNSFKEKNEIVSQLVLRNNDSSLQAWKRLREDLFTASKQVTDNNIDSFILNLYITEGRYSQAKSYINYLQLENTKLNLASLGKCFKLHYFLCLEKLCTKEDEENILIMYENLLKEYPILDSITNEQIILGLSVTKQWRKCFQILKDIKITATPGTATYNALICAAFCHDDFDTGWFLFQEMIENNRQPLTSTYLTYLDRVATSEFKGNIARLDDLLNFIASYNLEINDKVAEKISSVTTGKAKNTSISRGGICKLCNKKLRYVELSTSEFEHLKNSFFENVIIGKDLFYKTTPEELKRFRNFVENMGKFDVIVDGLNVAYSAGVKQPPFVHSMLIASVVRHFIKQGKRVLVMGRTHMEKLPKKNWDFVKKHSTVFLINNISQDDPYILYCGLHSGINTIVVTRDFMRSHLYLLKDKQSKLLFNRWLVQSRYHLLHANEDKVFFKTPLPYMIVPQKDENYWHVPYIIDKDSAKEPIYKWLCIDT